MLEFAEIRHLDRMKGNFEVADEKEYVAVATLQKAHSIPQLIFSNIPEVVEQQQFVFDSFWEKATPAQQKINEIEKGIVSSITNILTDYKEAEAKEFDMIRNANESIKIIYSTPYAFHLQEKSGVLELLKKKADQQENLQINILVPIDSSIKGSLSHKLLTKNINNNIKILNIEPSIYIKIKSLEVDSKESLVIELKELNNEQNMEPVMGFSFYSNSLPTVLTYSCLFEMIHNQSIVAEELRHEGEIKDDFINTAAHELRTPTQAITGYSEMNDEITTDLLARAENFTVNELKNHLLTLHKQQKKISKNALRLNDLINNLLDVARLESNRDSKIILYKEKVDLVNEINNVIKLEFDQKIREKSLKISFINDTLGEHCFVYSDKSRVNQILTNLIDNAIKFSKKDESINIMIKDNCSFGINGTNDMDMATISSNHLISDNALNEIIKEEIGNQISRGECRQVQEENEVYIAISDAGKGISSKIMPRLFEKFATDSDFGTGLGLYISKKLVEAHGGRIWAFNNADEIGATFVFSLPR